MQMQFEKVHGWLLLCFLFFFVVFFWLAHIILEGNILVVQVWCGPA